MNEPAKTTLGRRIFQDTVAVLAVACFSLVLFYVYATLGLYGMIPKGVVNAATQAQTWLTLAGVIWVLWKRTPLLLAAPVLGLSAAFLTYLAWDDPAPPPPLTLSPLVPAGSKSYEVYRWLGKNGPDTKVKERPLLREEPPNFPQKPADWQTFVRQNRQRWEEAWTEDTLGREWLAGMAEHAPEGLYPMEGLSTPILDSIRVRHAVRCHWARAHLLLDEGRADEAARTLLTILRACYHLQRGGLTILTQMTAAVCTKGTYERLDLLLDSGALSTETKAQITTILRQAPNIRQNIAQAFAGEEIVARDVIERMRDPDREEGVAVADSKTRSSPANLLRRFLYNPNRTEREHVAYLHDASRLSQERRSRESTESMRRFELLMEERTVKNPVGYIVAAMSMPANVVIESFWKCDDLRLALLKRLEPSR